MQEKEKTQVKDKKEIKSVDFYQQACSYFYYHAEQRTTMINFFIAVFAACIALYGSLLSVYPIASVLISVFLAIVSFLFFMIDLRNRFDVKQSQGVIAQMERDCGVDVPNGESSYGVFSNEDNVYKFYKRAYRRNNKEYKDLMRAYKMLKKFKISEKEFDEKLNAVAKMNPNASVSAIKESLKSRTIYTLSSCIKALYIVCGIISLMAFGFALVSAIGII